MWAEDRWLVHFLTYENGVLVTGATRGDGSVSEGYYRNIERVKDIPLVLPEPVNVQFEASTLHLQASFDRVNQIRQETSGLLIRGMLLQVTSPIGCENRGPAKSRPSCIKKWVRRIKAVRKACLKLARLGFVVNQERVLAEGYGANLGLVKKLTQLPGGSSYDIDGIVIKGQWPSCSRKNKLYRKSSLNGLSPISFQLKKKKQKFYQSIGRLDRPVVTPTANQLQSS